MSRRWMLTLVPLVLLAAGTLGAVPAPPTGSLFGLVVDWQHRPVPFANVVVLNAKLGTLTDENGIFRLPRVPEGVQVLRAITFREVSAFDTVRVTAGTADTLLLEVMPRLPSPEYRLLGASPRERDPRPAAPGPGGRR